ncbi:MAG: hypothetical protein ABI234_00960 [Ktedonobacteraceae bacterium]
MSNKQALLDCTFSWGKTCRLYRDSIEIAGKSYSLDDLTYIHPTYRTVLGIASARLELCFGLRRLTLRGIPDPETAREMVSHLLPYAEQAGPHIISHRVRSRTTQARDLARAQAKTWERTQKIPALLDALRPSTSTTPASTPLPESDKSLSEDQTVSQSEVADVFDDFQDFAEQPTSHVPTNDLPVSVLPASEIAEDMSEQSTLPVPASSLPLPEQPTEHMPVNPLPLSAQPSLPIPAEALSAQPISPTSIGSASDLPSAPMLEDAPSVQPTRVAAANKPSRPLPVVKIQPTHIPRREPPLRPVQRAHPRTSLEQTLARVSAAQSEKRNPLPALEQTLTRVAAAQAEKRNSAKSTPETGSAPVSALKSNVLPIIQVPVRLQPGEYAHYSSGAALCGDQLTNSEQAIYPPLDRGLLILTNQRIFYLGKRCQLMLAYTHLWYVSLLQDAVALHIEGQFRRIIMEIEQPQAWASRIEQLSLIARRSPSHPAQPAPMYVLPDVKPASSLPITVKRAALKLPTAQVGTVSTTASTPASATHISQHTTEATTIELASQAKQGIVEAITIELASPANQSIIEVTTIELDPLDGELEDIDTQTFSLPNEEEEVTSKQTALSARAQVEMENVDTCILSIHNHDDEATSKLEAVSVATQAEQENTRLLVSHDQDDAESEDEQTVPVRHRKIAAISTHPLHTRTNQPNEKKVRRSTQSRTLSRTLPLEEER